MVGYSFWGVDDGPTHGVKYRRSEEYRDRKASVTEKLLAGGEALLGPFRDHIVHLETATPLSQERYTRSTEGTSYGLRFDPGQSGEHRPQHRTEIEGLYLVGASTFTGHGIGGAMVGVRCAPARSSTGRCWWSRCWGVTLVDPAVIPPDPVGFDPVETSRGPPWPLGGPRGARPGPAARDQDRATTASPSREATRV